MSRQDRTSASELSSPSVSPVRGQLSKTQSEPSMAAASESDFNPDDIPAKGSSCDLNLPSQKLLWRAAPKPANADQVRIDDCSVILCHSCDTDVDYHFNVYAHQVEAAGH
jgi:hypothetical protein